MVNNPNKTSEALLWLQHTLREIWGDGRWWFHMTSRTRQLPPYDGSNPLYLPFPTGYDELIEPIFYRTDTVIGSSITISDTSPLPAGTAGLSYSYAFQLSGGDDGWTIPTKPWVMDYVLPMRLQDADYSVKQFGIEFAPKFNAGGAIWISYYENPTIPTLTTEAIPLPDQFVYRLAVYGAARHGLIGEDDYDRLQIAKAEFTQALDEMRIWNNRKKIANASPRAASQMPGRYYDYSPGMYPPNFSL
mgnify:FL=1